MEDTIDVAEQPRPEEVAFELDRTLSSVVSLRTRIPPDAMTASVLGTTREGHGVIIGDDGLIVTIGYLVTEADSVWITDATGRTVPGHVVGYDQESGFGLVQALSRLDQPAIPLGSSAALSVGDYVTVAGCGGRHQAVRAEITSRREFAGYWEYLLDEAIFTTPPHPNWGGAGMLGVDGTLRGIGSLFVQETTAGETNRGHNMIVPIDLLKPILDDLLRFGRVNKPARPWLGMFATEVDDSLVVAGVVDDGPANLAEVSAGDLILKVAGTEVHDLASLFRRVWSLGPAGVDVPFMISREGETLSVSVKSVDRHKLLKAPQLH